MAQRQYTTFQADILSFELRDALLGILKPGRYIGYNLMAEYQAQVGDNVYCRFSHPAGMPKYDQQSLPVLEATRGIVLTTQGTIITEDGNVDVTVTLINGGASDTVVHLLYMEHVYDGAVPGANNAIYGIKSGTEGGGIPALTNPTKQVIIGTVIEPIGATQFSDLTYHLNHPGVGDEELFKKLFKSNTLDELTIGTMPPNGEGIIGSRNFPNNNYLTDYDSLTEALSDLDAAVKTRADAIAVLQATKLDNWATPDDNEDLNATITYHGLLKKLPNVAAQYLNGVGSWDTPLGKTIKWRPTIPSGDDFNYVVATGGTQDFDLSTIVTDSDAEIVILDVSGFPENTTSSGSGTYKFHADGEAWSTGVRVTIVTLANIDFGAQSFFIMAKMASRVISITYAGGIAPTSLGFRVMGWISAL